MNKSVFNTEKNIDFTKQPMFFGKSLQVQRYDNMKYPIFDKLCQRQLGYFWRPEEISLQIIKFYLNKVNLYLHLI